MILQTIGLGLEYSSARVLTLNVRPRIEITAQQYARIGPHLPLQRGNVSHENLNVVNAILFVAEKLQVACTAKSPISSP